MITTTPKATPRFTINVMEGAERPGDRLTRFGFTLIASYLFALPRQFVGAAKHPINQSAHIVKTPYKSTSRVLFRHSRVIVRKVVVRAVKAHLGAAVGEAIAITLRDAARGQRSQGEPAEQL